MIQLLSLVKKINPGRRKKKKTEKYSSFVECCAARVTLTIDIFVYERMEINSLNTTYVYNTHRSVVLQRSSSGFEKKNKKNH